MEDNDLSWNSFSKDKAFKPTYRYRNDNLLRAVKDGVLCSSTASSYMLHVIKFYEWAIHEQLFKLDETAKPFEYDFVNISNNGVMSHLNKFFIVRTTDLKIKVPNRGEQQSLNPLNEAEISTYVSKLQGFNEEFTIHQLLQIQSGLRVEEACSFPLSLVCPPPYQNTYIEVSIGPHNGVRTKFGKKRVIEISNYLMHRMYTYSVGERRAKKQSKNHVQLKHIPLLLNQSGRPLTSDGVQRSFHRLREKIRQTGILFDHRTHDLRSTYATYKLSTLLKYLEPSDAMALLMGWLGHKDEKTTWKYLRFIEKDRVYQEAISMLDAILDEALTC